MENPHARSSAWTTTYRLPPILALGRGQDLLLGPVHRCGFQSADPGLSRMQWALACAAAEVATCRSSHTALETAQWVTLIFVLFPPCSSPGIMLGSPWPARAPGDISGHGLCSVPVSPALVFYSLSPRCPLSLLPGFVAFFLPALGCPAPSHNLSSFLLSPSLCAGNCPAALGV